MLILVAPRVDGGAPEFDGYGRLPRTNLLVYHTGQGAVAEVKSKADWEKRRREVLHGMEEVMGPFPGPGRRCELGPRIEEEKDCGAYVQRRMTYVSEPGSRVPAYLLVPKAGLVEKKRLPAVLALHPTDMEYGCRVVIEPLREHYRAYGRDLAERGFVVLAPAYPLMAGYNPDLKALGYKSGTMKAIWDNCRELDFLETLPFVRKGKFGAIGHSLGGHNAIYTAVWDQRIKVVVSSCGFDCFPDYMGGDITGWTSERYMPRLANYRSRLDQVPFDFPELLGALAPREVFISAPVGDTNFRWQSVDTATGAAMQVYRLYGKSERLRVVHPEVGHDFPEAVRLKAYEAIEQGLR